MSVASATRSRRSGQHAGPTSAQHGPDRQRLLRCAVYTRVSTEHGLDMEFNSLDAQREACEAYIKSQRHEGWSCLPAAYNDGGFSGGSLERPDMQRLMADIRAGALDIVVVYKVDRLTRSLADFAKLVELFDAHGVSFVSVTQAFNTTSSMGRLTLNVLLSFAQFEREVSGERIRDKIAASKRKGIRMGGPVPLGYGLKDKKLVPDEVEAETVRAIFRGYIEHGTLTALMKHLDANGIVTKRTRRRDGSQRGGVRFGKGALAYLLRNRVYVGEIAHKDQWYPAEHPPIVDRETFDAVQAALSRQGETQARRRLAGQDLFPLTGRIFDDRGNRMTPTVARKNCAHYRYYVSSALAQGRRAEAGTISRVAALPIEEALQAALSSDPNAQIVGDPPTEFASIDRIVIRKGRIDVSFLPIDANPRAPMSIPWTHQPSRRHRATILSDDGPAFRPMRAETRARLLLGIAKARLWLDDLLAGRVKSLLDIARREGCSERSIRKNLNLAFLPPALVKAVLDGSAPDSVGIAALADMPTVWDATIGSHVA